MAFALNSYELVASVCQDSFYDFLQEFWYEVPGQEEPVWNWHIRYLCAEYQRAAERVIRGVPKRRDGIINVPPGSTKSTIFSIMGPAWVWTRMPHCKFICASHTLLLALDLANKSRAIIRSDKYQACFPNIVLRRDQDTKGYFANTRGGMRYSVGTGGSVIGMHGHIITVDDPLDPTAAASEEELKTANKFVTETLPTRKINKALTMTWLIMQRLHQNDPTGHMIDKRKGDVDHYCLPAEVSDMVMPNILKEQYVDGLLDPVRLNRAVLKEAYGDLGEYGYSCQFRQHPIPPGGGKFKVDLITIRRCMVPENKLRAVRYWDKAATTEGGAFSVGFLMGAEKLDDGTDRYWILDVIRGQWDSYDREMRIKATAQRDGRRVRIGLEQEPGSGGKESLEGTIRRLAGYSVHVDKPTTLKELRADEFSTQVNGGNVFMVPAIWNASLLEEMRFFPYGTFMDQVDAGSGAFNMLAAKRTRIGAFLRRR